MIMSHKWFSKSAWPTTRFPKCSQHIRDSDAIVVHHSVSLKGVESTLDRNIKEELKADKVAKQV